MYKVLLLDLDGSLLSSDKTISNENKKAIKKAVDSGVMVSIGSGRPVLDIYGYIEELDLKDCYHVADNGLSVFKHGEEPERFKFFDEETYKYLLDKLFENKSQFAFLSDDSGEYLLHDALKLEEAISSPGANSLSSKKLSKEEMYNVKNAYKVLAYFEAEDEYNFAKELEKNCDMEASIVSKGFINYMPGGVSKFTGAETLGEKLGISTENMAAIGDEENDYAIIKNIGLGIAPKNASDKIKDVADVVLDVTNDEDAVAKLIYDYILG